MISVKSKRQKGKEYEQLIVDEIIKRGLDARCKRDGASGAGNREKADISTDIQINGVNIGIEAKNQETLHIPEWFKQAEKLEVLNREPVLAFKLPNRNPRVNLVCLKLETFLDMLVGLQGEDDINSNLAENYTYDKTKHLNSLIYLKDSLSRSINEYKKKIIKEN